MTDPILPPASIVKLILETWKRQRTGLAKELVRSGYARAMAVETLSMGLDFSGPSKEATAQMHEFGYSMRFVEPLFPSFPYTYIVQSHGVEVERGTCVEGFKPYD